MLAALPNPILSVTPEGVRELDGREALSGLWTLFSKCKESIENGRRLENISWRLWYRDMLVSTSVQCAEANCKAANLPVEDECLSEKTYRPPTPMETVLPPPSDQDPSAHLTVSPSLYSGSPHSITQLATSQSIPCRHQFHSDGLRRPRRPLAVGQIICEIANAHPSPATSPSFLPLSMLPSYGGVTRVPRPEPLAPLPASLSRSDLGGSNVYISGSALLPLLPLLPLPEPNSTLGAALAAPSQLPTPGTERDESAPFDSIPQGHPAPPPDTPSHTLPSIPGPLILSLSRHQEPRTSSSDVPPDSTPACLTVTAPPSPSLSDSYIRAHPLERTTVDHPPDAGVPVIGTLVQPPNLSQMHSDAGVERSSPVSSDPQPVTVPVLYEDTPAPVVATPPRLVVVNPTPGPTPHPTPPATPLSFLPGTDSRLRPHGQFLAPPSTRAVPQQLTPIQAPVFTKLDVGTPTLGLPVGGSSDLLPGQVSLTPRLRLSPQGFGSGKLRQQLGTQSTPTPTSAIQSTPPTQDPASVEGARRPRVDESTQSTATSQAPASHNPNRLSTSSTASTSSTGATTTTSDISSSSRLSMGASSINTDVSSGQQPSNAGSSDELKTLASLGLTEATLTSSPQHAEVASPVSPTSPRASTSVNSVKSTKSTASTGTRATRRTGAPGLTRRASSGAASTGGGRSRKAGNVSTVNRATSNSSDSRSRSRDAVSRKSVAAAAGALAATIGMTTTSVAGPSGGARRRVGAKAAVGKGRPGLARTVSRGGGSGGAGLKRTLSHEDVEEVTDEDDGEEEAAAAAAAVREEEQRVKEERERELQREAAEREAATREKERQVMSKPSRPKFKFGSNSDNGSNAGTEISSRAPGSEVYGVYDVKGKGRETEESLAAQERHAQELRERELAVQRTREAAAVLEREKQVKKEQARKEADAVARVKAQESLADPLLPQGTKRTILLTSESDYTDTDDDASWTSEDVDERGAVEAPASRQQPPSARQSSHQESRHAQQNAQQHHPQQQQHPPPPHPPTVQRTHSTVSGAGRTTRRELQHIQQRREAQVRVQRAAAQLQREEERQREMFAKKPTRSFQNLTELQRTTSTGLLTQLMNPDPSIFPANHPYRRGHSSGEIQRMGMTPMMSMTSVAPAVQPLPSRTRSQPLDQQQPAPLPQQQRRPVDERPPPEAHPAPAPPVQQQPPQLPRQQQQNVARRPPPRRSVTLDSHMMPPPPPPVATTSAAENKGPAVPPSPVRSERRAPSVAGAAIGFALRGMRNLGFGSGKSTTAGPMASQVVAGSVSTKHVAKVPDAAPTSPDARSPGSSTGYRPKGPLPGQEMETDSEDEVEENSVQLSKSVAQDRLKQFAARRGIVAAGPALSTQPENEDIPAWAREEPNASGQTAVQQPAQAAAAAPAPGPIPVMHPYNLPVNAVPSTPRTTRRQMLRNEMSESLRRQLLWERQQAGVPIRRTTSTGHVGPQRNNTLNGLKPLTTTPSMVQLHAKGTVNRQQSNLRQEVQAGPSNAIRGSGDRERRASSRQSEGNQEARRQALARNRSWTNDYHTSGW